MTTTSVTYQSVDCPLCHQNSTIEVYSRQRDFGEQLGQILIRVALCQNCHFVYNNPRISDHDLERHYATSLLASGQIFRSSGHNSYYTQLHKKRALLIHAALSDLSKQTKSILDIGCGSGQFLEALKDTLGNSIDYLGIDPSAEACKNTLKRGMKTKQGYLDDKKYSPGSIQLATLVSVLEHVGEPIPLLESINTILAEDGLFYLEVPNLLRAEFSLTGFFGLEHIIHFTPATIAKMLEITGFNFIQFLDGPKANICLIASKKYFPNALDINSVPDDQEETLLTIERYTKEETEFIKNMQRTTIKKLEEWQSQGLSIGLYGAGQHSLELSSWIPFSHFITDVFDSDPRKHGSLFLGFEVKPPEALSEGNTGACLISSKPFAEEIRQTIRKFGSESIKTADCYSSGA